MQIDAYDSPETEALLPEALLGSGRERFCRTDLSLREWLTRGTLGGGFVLAATLLALLAPWHRSLSVTNLLLVSAAYLIAERVRFPVIKGYAAASELAIVPMLFLLPVPAVPLVVGALQVLSRARDFRDGWRCLSMIPACLSYGWYAVGPAAVLTLAGQQPFAWSHWPVYLAALGAQLLFDAASTVANVWFADGVKPSVQLPLLSWIYVVDVTLAPLGLLIAYAAVRHPALVLLALSPMAMLALFARERKQRLDETIALSTAYRGTAILLGDVVEVDDHYTGLHSREVVDLALAVADELGLQAAQRRDVEFAALLHDVGKIRIPKEIINKPGSLDAREWAVIREHTIEGEAMLQQVGGVLASVGRIVRASHERYDGEGYPDRLAGETIPIEARIVCACDAYSAMTTDRPYRGAMSVSDAMDELRRCSGTQFDPHVVAAIERIMPQPATSAFEYRAVGDRERVTGRELYAPAHQHA